MASHHSHSTLNLKIERTNFTMKVVEAIYDLATGKTRWLSEEPVMEILNMAEESPDKQTEPFATE